MIERASDAARPAEHGDTDAALAPAAEATTIPPSARSPSSRWRLPISAVLVFGFGGLVAAAVGAVLFLSLDLADRTTHELLRLSAEDEIDRVVDALAHHLQPARDLVEFVAAEIERGAIPPEDDGRLQDLLLGTLAASPQVSAIAYIREDLHAVRAGNLDGGRGTEAGSWVDRPEVRLAVRDGATETSFSWGDPVYAEREGTTFFAPRRPVRIDGVYRGLVTATVSVTEMSAFLAESADAFGGVTFVLYGRDHVFAHPSLARPPSERTPPPLSVDHPLSALDEVGDPVLAAIWGAPAGGFEDILADVLEESSVQGQVVRVGDDQHVVLYREIADYGEPVWVVGIHFSAEAVGGPLQRLALAAAVGVGILILAVIVALLLGRSIARPVSRLAAVADAIRELQPARLQTLPRSPFRELDSAALAFNSMLFGLRWFATYVPRSLVELLMRRGSQELLSEERQLTVLFTDIIGFSAIARRLAPPQLAEFLNRHFALLGACIEAEGGTVDKYIGDSIMAFWGAPEPQPDHAERACRAARRVAEVLSADNARRAGKGLRPVRVRIGLHSGPAIAGNIGAPGRINYTLIGDTVNTAQRLEQLGKIVDDGTSDAVVLVSGATAAQVRCMDLTPIGTHVLRGREEETEVYRLS